VTAPGADQAAQVAHLVRLYDNPGFGPDYVRHAVRAALDLPGYPHRDLGRLIRQELDKRSEENGRNGSDQGAEQLPAAGHG
jgi:hypothetical protein